MGLTTEQPVHALLDFRFTDRQARFLDLVLRHAGVCVPRQYAQFAGVAHGGARCNAFFTKLIRRGYEPGDGRLGRGTRARIGGPGARRRFGYRCGHTALIPILGPDTRRVQVPLRGRQGAADRRLRDHRVLYGQGKERACTVAERRLKIWYDREGDFLEVMFEDRPGYFRETANDQVMEKVDEAGHVIGFSVLKVSSLQSAPLEVALSQ